MAVPLDRSGTLPGTVSLLVRIRPSLSGGQAGTILALAGGPGQAAAPLLDRFASVLPGAVLASRQLVTFDQRGTGSSDPLACPSSARPASGAPLPAALDPEQPLLDSVAVCAAHLGPARAHYTTADSVADIDAVRAALGVDKLTLWGTSYGTKVALDYAVAYPQHVERLLLDSVVPPTGVDPFERVTIGSMPRVMRLVCAGRCHAFTRDPAADLDAIARRLARGPLRGRWVDAFGRAESVAVTEQRLLSLLIAGDFSPQLRALLPAALHAARAGDPALLLRLATVGGGAPVNGINSVVLIATRCEDGSVPWAPGTPIADRSGAIGAALAAIPPAQLFPFDAAGVRSLRPADLCRSWPESPTAQTRLPLPDVPTLILSGALDLRTPRANAVALASQIPSARVVNVPQTGHSALSSDRSGCARAAVAAFFAGERPAVCRPRRLGFFEAPASPPPTSLRRLRPIVGVPLRAGRTLAAVRETFTFLARTLLFELAADPRVVSDSGASLDVGGLRGGLFVLAGSRAYLRDYSVVPGVALSGRIDEGERRRPVPVVVRVGGAAAARGWLRLGRRWIVGRLAGRPVRVRAQSLVAPPGSAARAAAGPDISPGPLTPTLPASARALLRIPAR